MNKVQALFLPPKHLKKMVVAEFDQSATAEYATFPGGYCAGLSLNWLNMRLRNQDWPATQADPQTAINATTGALTYTYYKKWQENYLREKNPVSVLARGALGRDSIGLIESVPTQQLRSAIDAVAGGLNLEIDGEVKLWNNGEGGHDFIHRLVVLGVGLYYISMSTPVPNIDDQSHAIAMHIYASSTDTDCEFFDPNVGQLHLGNPVDMKWTFYDLLKAYTAAYGYNFSYGRAFRMKKKY